MIAIMVVLIGETLLTGLLWLIIGGNDHED